MKSTAPTTPRVVTVSPRTCLAIGGTGAPSSARFQDSMHALFAVYYGLKFDLKQSGGPAVRPTPVEGLWWMNETPPRWKLLMEIPSDVPAGAVERVREAAARRGVSHAAEVAAETLDEGACVEVLHLGPYSTEAEDIDRMHALMIEGHLRPAGPHHEIYLSDPRRSRPEAIRTILRQPVT